MSLFDAIKKFFSGFGNPESEVSEWTAELNRNAEDMFSTERNSSAKTKGEPSNTTDLWGTESQSSSQSEVRYDADEPKTESEAPAKSVKKSAESPNKKFDPEKSRELIIVYTAQEVRKLVKDGADPNFVSEHGFTPLMFADDPEVIKALVECGADPNAKDENGYPVIVKMETPECIKTLVECGADVNAKAEGGRTALM